MSSGDSTNDTKGDHADALARVQAVADAELAASEGNAERDRKAQELLASLLRRGAVRLHSPAGLAALFPALKNKGVKRGKRR